MPTPKGKRKRKAAAPPQPPADLPLEDRERAVRIVRGVWEVLDLVTGQLLRRTRETAGKGYVPSVDHQMAQGLLALAKTADQIQATHPGLLGLVHGPGESGVGDAGAIAGEDAVERVRAALRAAGHPDPD